MTINSGLFGRLCAFFIVSILALVSAGSQAGILFDGRFESGVIYPLTGGDTDSFFYGSLAPGCTSTNSVPSNTGYSAGNDNRLVTSPVRYGSYANAQTIHYGCDYRSYNGGLQKPRQELGVTKTSLKILNNQERWVGFSVRVPATYTPETTDAQDMNIFQLKRSTDTTCCAFNLLLNQSQFLFQIKYLQNSSGTALDSANYYAWPLEQGVWNDVAVHFKLCTQAEKVAGCTPFLNLYVSVDGENNTTPVATWSGNANTTLDTTGGTKFYEGPKINTYKWGWHCPSSYTVSGKTYTQADYSQCMSYNNGTLNTGSITVYFDELMVGDASSSLSEIAPYLSSAPPSSGASIISMNTGSPLDDNLNPVTYTTSGGDTKGVIGWSICKTGTAECASIKAVNSDASGGRFATDDMTGITGDGVIPVTATASYDNTMQVDSEDGVSMSTLGGGSNWSLTSLTSPPTAIDSSTQALKTANFGYLDGVTVCNSGAAAGYLNSPTYSANSGDTIRHLIAIKRTVGATTTPGLRVITDIGGSRWVAKGTVGSGGSFATNTTATGSGHTFTRTLHSDDVETIDLQMTATATGTYKTLVGPESTTSGVCANVLGVKTWVNPSFATVDYSTYLSRPDATAPSLTECDMVAITTSSAQLSCLSDDNTGEFYAVITNSSTAPNLDQCKEGKDHTGATAMWSGSQAATSGTFTASNLDPYTDKYAYFCQTDAAANDSAVVAAETSIPAETPPSTTKKIAFRFAEGNDTSLACRSAQAGQASQYNSADEGSGDIFIVIGSGNPRPSPGGQFPTILAYDTNATIVNGEYDLDESDLEYGSINALDTGDQGYYMWASNATGSCRWSAPVQVIAE